jgi:dTDP-4-amino-4,6-dideoxygalactose transaminase
LKRLEKLNSTRRKLAYYLSHLLSEIDGITPPYEIPDVLPTYHLYNALVNENEIKISRNRLLKQLWIKKRIMTATQYYPPLHRTPVFKALGHKEGEYPAAEDLSARLITLPLSPRFNGSDMEELAAGIKDVINNAV